MSDLFNPNNDDTFINNLIRKDRKMSKRFAFYWGERLQINRYKNYTAFLDYSCSGIVWVVGLLAFSYLSKRNHVDLQINLLMQIILDIAIVAVMKAYFQRDPPSYCDIHPLNIEYTYFSFPSGCTTRATLIFTFFSVFYPIPLILLIFVYIWFFLVCLTRVLSKKHFLLDVFGGMVIAIIEAYLFSFILVEKETAMSIFNWISDEKTAGSDAEVL